MQILFCVCYANNVFIPFKVYNNEFNVDLKKNDEVIFDKIKKDINNKKFSEAFIKTSKISDPVNKNIIQTIITAEGFKEINVLNYKNFNNLILFNTNNNYLPFFSRFHSTIEKYYINNTNVNYNDVKDYFEIFKPLKAQTYIKLLKQEDNYIFENFNGEELENKKNELNKKIINIWLNSNFSSEEDLLFYNKYQYIIKEENLIRKMEYLSFEKDKSKLISLLTILKNENYKKLFNVIIKLDDNPKHINNILREVPKNLRENESLLFAKAKYFRKNKKDKEVLKILYSLKDSVSKYPQKWWLYRHIYIRDLIREKEYKKAYYIAVNHGKLERVDMYDAEWLCGWIALRFLDKPTVALEHFEYAYNNSSYPISLSKAGYWLGKANQELKNLKQAEYWYKKASEFPFTFYGQISLKTLSDMDKKNYDITIPEMPEVKENIELSRVTRFAYFYYKYLGQNEKAFDLFKKAIIESDSSQEIAYIIALISNLDNYNFLISMSKIANYKKVYFVDYLYPIIKLINKNYSNISFVHGIIKQESNFKFNAISSAGATGFMQIMPETAKSLCKDLNITYNNYKLKHDIQYNIRLGSYYIEKLLNSFNGSKVLTIASYNAGRGNVNKWIKGYGNPKKYTEIDDVIDWIECIPFGETRNYVKRVLENIIVYDTILQNYYPIND